MIDAIEARSQYPYNMSQQARLDPISTSLIDKVLQQAQATASHSWEYGVVFEALLEYHTPSLTVFHTTVSRHQKHLSDHNGAIPALKYVTQHIRTDSTTLCEGNGITPVSVQLYQRSTSPP